MNHALGPRTHASLEIALTPSEGQQVLDALMRSAVSNVTSAELIRVLRKWLNEEPKK